MIEEMAAAYWRMRRAWAMENQLLTSGLDAQPGGDPRSSITASFRQLASSPELALLHRYETRLHMMYQRALHNILLLRTVGPPVGQILGLPTHPSPSQNPAVDPDQPSPVCPAPDVPLETGPSAHWDRPSSSVVCQPASSQPEQVPDLPTPPQPCTVGQALGLPTQQHTPGMPNEPSPTSGHSPVPRQEPGTALPRLVCPLRATLHSACHPRGAAHPISRYATNPHSPKPSRQNRPRRSIPPAFPSPSFPSLKHRTSTMPALL